MCIRDSYTFERFVVGSSNRYAYSAARAVADIPGRAGYNPLFIYGESGLGKTHLLYAIAHTIHANHPDYKIVYIKGDTFTNELVAAIREGRNQQFREKYREADVFLMDEMCIRDRSRAHSWGCSLLGPLPPLGRRRRRRLFRFSLPSVPADLGCPSPL